MESLSEELAARALLGPKQPPDLTGSTTNLISKIKPIKVTWVDSDPNFR